MRERRRNGAVKEGNRESKRDIGTMRDTGGDSHEVKRKPNCFRGHEIEVN